MTTWMRHRPWIASTLVVLATSVALHHFVDPRFGNRWLSVGVAALIAFSLVIMGWSTDVWTTRSLGLGWILTGVALYFGWIGLWQFGLLGRIDGWELSIIRGCLWVGAVLFAVGVVQWIRDPLRNEGPDERGVTEGARRERLR